MLYLAPFLTSLAAALLIARSAWASQNAKTIHQHNIQSSHLGEISRLGGVAILAGVLMGISIVGVVERQIFFYVFVSSTPLIAGGFLDDVTQAVSPRTRLLLGLSSGVLFIIFTGYVVTNIDTPVIELLFRSYPIAFFLTVVALAGVGHGLNIIDGFNGLASGSAAVMFAGLAILAHRSEDQLLWIFAITHAAVAFGFFCVNFPKGPIFLGDGGVYYLGFALATNVVMLIVRNPYLSPWVATLVILYPILEALFSIFRKTLTKGHHPFAADDRHLHHLFWRVFLNNRLGVFRRKDANPLTGLAMITFTGVCGAAAQIGYKNPPLTIILVIGVTLIYLITYGFLTYQTTRKN